MKRFILAIFFLGPLLCMSQTDVLIFQKNGRNIKTYAPGQQITIHTIYDQWLDGTVTALRNDSVFINNNPFHVDEIDGIHMEFSKWNYQADGTILIIAGVGVLVLNVANGLYTNEKSGNWVRTSGWITAGALILAGLLLKAARHKNYPIGKKYTLHYLNMHVDRPPSETNPGSKTTEPAK